VITIEVKGVSRHIDIEPDTPLLWVLRDVIGLTGIRLTPTACRNAGSSYQTRISPTSSPSSALAGAIGRRP